MDAELAKLLWQIVQFLLLPLIYFLCKRCVNKLDDDLKKFGDEVKTAKENSHRQALELEKYKVYVSENYASKYEVNESLKRIHDRIDDVADDIKTILSKVK